MIENRAIHNLTGNSTHVRCLLLVMLCSSLLFCSWEYNYTSVATFSVTVTVTMTAIENTFLSTLISIQEFIEGLRIVGPSVIAIPR